MLKRDRGRGELAVADMRARIAAMKAAGLDIDQIVSALWDRCARAEAGAGYDYELATADPVRPDGQRGEQAGR